MTIDITEVRQMCLEGKENIENCETHCQKISEFYIQNGFLYEYCGGCGHYTMYHREGNNWMNGPTDEDIAGITGKTIAELKEANIL